MSKTGSATIFSSRDQGLSQILAESRSSSYASLIVKPNEISQSAKDVLMMALTEMNLHGWRGSSVSWNQGTYRRCINRSIEAGIEDTTGTGCVCFLFIIKDGFLIILDVISIASSSSSSSSIVPLHQHFSRHLRYQSNAPLNLSSIYHNACINFVWFLHSSDNNPSKRSHRSIFRRYLRHFS